MLISTKPGYQV